MLLYAFYLFIELLTVKENVLYMSFNAILCIKRSKYMVVAQLFKNHVSFLKQFSYQVRIQRGGDRGSGPPPWKIKSHVGFL